MLKSARKHRLVIVFKHRTRLERANYIAICSRARVKHRNMLQNARQYRARTKLPVKHRNELKRFSQTSQQAQDRLLISRYALKR